MEAVVEATVFVPLTLYVTVYVPEAREVELMVTVAPLPEQTGAAEAVKLLTAGVAFTVTNCVAVLVHPLVPVTVTVYVLLAVADMLREVDAPGAHE
jgi:hypothetical protein